MTQNEEVGQVKANKEVEIREGALGERRVGVAIRTIARSNRSDEGNRMCI